MSLGSEVVQRIYADYLAPDRYDEYRRLIEKSLAAGFRHYTIAEAHEKAAFSTIPDDEKVFVHRHDIDTDLKGARSFFEIEKRCGIRATYYFRLTTIDIPLMREIHAAGGEVGYHYEELATFAKRKGLISRQAVLKNLGVVAQEFESNLRRIEKELGFKIRTVASHGDFANRRLDITNIEILKDSALRERLAIECEGYDSTLMNFFDVYLSDAPPKRYYIRGSPFEAIRSKRRICLLTHPRHWGRNAIVNTKDNLLRVGEEIRWRMAELKSMRFVRPT
jgi:hypothetical protein